MRNYIKKFIRDDEGAELIQFAIVVGMAALLAGAVALVFRAANNKVVEAQDLIEGLEIGGEQGGLEEG